MVKLTGKGMASPVINNSDLVYSYKEQVFDGFAPCFQDGVYSLACCKGAKSGNGMRQSICKAVEAGKTAWVLAIAAGGIAGKNNKSGIDYAPGDAIYLAKIDYVCTWQEYSEAKEFRKRADSYYVLKNGEVTWRKAIKNTDRHGTREALEHDCALGAGNLKGRTEADVFWNDRQILIAHEYYVFDKGQQISVQKPYEDLDVGRGYRYVDKGKVSRSAVSREFLKKNHAYYCVSGIDPFAGKVSNKGGGCK